MRSPAMPKNGEIRVPRNCSEAKIASTRTEPVETSKNQFRITPSISKAQEASRSAGHWKRKLRTWNGASTGTRERAITVLFVFLGPALLARLHHGQSAGMPQPVQRTPAHAAMAATAGHGAECRLTSPEDKYSLPKIKP